MKIRGPSDPTGPIEGAEGQAPTTRTSFAERLDRTEGARPGQPSELCENDPLVGERLRRLGERSSR